MVDADNRLIWNKLKCHFSLTGRSQKLNPVIVKLKGYIYHYPDTSFRLQIP